MMFMLQRSYIGPCSTGELLLLQHFFVNISSLFLITFFDFFFDAPWNPGYAQTVIFISPKVNMGSIIATTMTKIDVSPASVRGFTPIYDGIIGTILLNWKRW